MDAREKLEFEQLIEELGEYKGRHTELISVCIPSGFNVNQVTRQIEDEKGTAVNIKSKGVRKNVIDALERISRFLKGLKQTPPNGLAIFSGNVSGNEGQGDIELWTIEPPKPLKIRLYRCDQTFVLEPLSDMVAIDEVYPLLIIERNEASIGILEGKSIKLLQTLTSGIPGKIRAGGQSSQRFHRITEGLAKEFFRRVSESLKKHFFENKKIKGILIGGPIPTKDEFLDSGNLVTKLKEKVIAVRDIGDTGMPGLRELVEKSQDALIEQEITIQKKILDEFFMALAKTPFKVAYGESEVKKRLEQGVAGKLILSKILEKQKIRLFEKLALETGVEVHIVSNETSQGVQFDNIGGIGALLRFEVHD